MTEENSTANDTSSVTVGEALNDFILPATSLKDVQLSALSGYNVVIYFYPKDSTPGCTKESQDFSAHYEDFKASKTCVFGVSRDSLKSHEKFKAALELPFELISDENETLCNTFGVIKLKQMYGREVLGVERSTFLIDANGVLRQEWRKVKIEGHVAEVLAAAKELGEGELTDNNSDALNNDTDEQEPSFELTPTPGLGSADVSDESVSKDELTRVEA